MNRLRASEASAFLLSSKCKSLENLGSVREGNTEASEARSLFAAMATAARATANEVGLPVALEDEAVAALLSATGHNLKVPERQRLGVAVGLHAFPTERWHYHAPDLRMFCTAPVDPRPQPAWDDCLWLTPRQLLTRTNRKDAS